MKRKKDPIGRTLTPKELEVGNPTLPDREGARVAPAFPVKPAPLASELRDPNVRTIDDPVTRKRLQGHVDRAREAQIRLGKLYTQLQRHAAEALQLENALQTAVVETAAEMGVPGDWALNTADLVFRKS